MIYFNNRFTIRITRNDAMSRNKKKNEKHLISDTALKRVQCEIRRVKKTHIYNKSGLNAQRWTRPKSNERERERQRARYDPSARANPIKNFLRSRDFFYPKGKAVNSPVWFRDFYARASGSASSYLRRFARLFLGPYVARTWRIWRGGGKLWRLARYSMCRGMGRDK